MRVILTERVSGLGSIGEIVNVKVGFARNYLFPRQFALLADESNTRRVETEQKKLKKKIDSEKASARELKTKIDKLSFEIEKRVAGSGKLFGTVTSAEIAKLLQGEGIEIERRHVVFDRPVKEMGNYEVSIRFFNDVEGKLKIKVVMDKKQLEEIKEKQEMALKAKKDSAAQKAEMEAAEAAAASAEVKSEEESA